MPDRESSAEYSHRFQQLLENGNPPPRVSISPLKIALTYALGGALWIILSDQLAGWIAIEKYHLIVVQILKGLAFISVSSILVYWLARHARQTAEEKLHKEHIRSRQRFFQATLSSIGEAVLIIDPSTRTILECNTATERVFGYGRAELIGQSSEKLHVNHQAFKKWGEESEKVLQNGGIYETTSRMKRKDGTIIDTAHTVSTIDEEIGMKGGVVSIVRDITERVEAQRDQRQTQERLENVLSVIPALVYIVKFPLKPTGTQMANTGEVNYLNAQKGFFGYKPEELDIKWWEQNIHPDDYDHIIGRMPQLLKDQSEYDREYRFCHADGSFRWIRDMGRVVTGKDKKKSCIGVWIDITSEKKALQETKRRVSQLSALHEIDLAISGSMDIGLTMQVLIDEVLNTLGADAAAVFTYDRSTNVMGYSHGDGFRSDLIFGTKIKPGDGYAGQAASERNIRICHDLRDARPAFDRPKLIDTEGFVTYHAVPLIAKDDLMGVMEVFHRKQLKTDNEWRDFLKTLSGQAAIAMENANLLEDLQQRNQDLRDAYDKTIQGWGRALDLRDEETEGHSLRVTKTAVDLARKCGIDGRELMYLRWGAALHDIGKIAVPDAILRKPGRLTPEERKVVEEHPVNAYNMLAPIDYLKPAIDIPYCHHEKWDGSGYPRGLSGKTIPIAARIFACVDVWDALRSDRPYRDAWPEEKVKDYMQEQSGQQFDPEILEKFINSMDT